MPSVCEDNRQQETFAVEFLNYVAGDGSEEKEHDGGIYTATADEKPAFTEVPDLTNRYGEKYWTWEANGQTYFSRSHPIVTTNFSVEVPVLPSHRACPR